MKTKKYVSDSVRVPFSPYFACSDFGRFALNLRGLALVVYVLLSNYAIHNYISKQSKYADDGTNQYLFASCSLRYIGYKCNCSLSSVKRVIKSLIENEILIKVSKLGNFHAVNGRAIYVINKFCDFSAYGFKSLGDYFAALSGDNDALMAQNGHPNKKANKYINSKKLTNNEKENNKKYIINGCQNVAVNDKYIQFLVSPDTLENQKKFDLYNEEMEKIISIAKTNWIID